jgi:RimJ/RimL family protein N-acetyltransferase
MLRDDKQRLMEFYGAVGDDDLRYFRHYVKDPALIEAWCDQLDYSKVLPVLGFVKERIVGSASLHFYDGPKRHVAEVRLFLAKDFRQRGLGMKMIRSLIDFARKEDIRILVAEVMAEKTKVVRAFEQLGFVSRCVLEDYFMFPDGDYADAVLMTYSLKPRSDEF